MMQIQAIGKNIMVLAKNLVEFGSNRTFLSKIPWIGELMQNLEYDAKIDEVADSIADNVLREGANGDTTTLDGLLKSVGHVVTGSKFGSQYDAYYSLTEGELDNSQDIEVGDTSGIYESIQKGMKDGVYDKQNGTAEAYLYQDVADEMDDVFKAVRKVSGNDLDNPRISDSVFNLHPLLGTKMNDKDKLENQGKIYKQAMDAINPANMAKLNERRRELLTAAANSKKSKKNEKVGVGCDGNGKNCKAFLSPMDIGIALANDKALSYGLMEQR